MEIRLAVLMLLHADRQAEESCFLHFTAFTRIHSRLYMQSVKKLYEVRDKSIWTGRVERKPDIIQLCAAMCRWVDLLWISVVSVTLT